MVCVLGEGKGPGSVWCEELGHVGTGGCCCSYCYCYCYRYCLLLLLLLSLILLMSFFYLAVSRGLTLMVAVLLL